MVCLFTVKDGYSSPAPRAFLPAVFFLQGHKVLPLLPCQVRKTRYSTGKYPLCSYSSAICLHHYYYPTGVVECIYETTIYKAIGFIDLNPSIWNLKGHVYKTIGREEERLAAFTKAINLLHAPSRHITNPFQVGIGVGGLNDYKETCSVALPGRAASLYEFRF